MFGLSVNEALEKIKHLLEKEGKSIELTLIGGLSLSFYSANDTRSTVDIDGEIFCDNETYEKLVAFLNSNAIPNNLGDNIDRWNVVPMPDGYRERVLTVKKEKNLTLKILEPTDFVFSKLRRATVQDLDDAKAVVEHCGISVEQLMDRFKKIQLPKSPESFLFKKNFEYFLNILSVNRTNTPTS
jgi:hypothetical protein